MTEQQVNSNNNLPTTIILTHDEVAELVSDIKRLIEVLHNHKAVVDSLLGDCARYYTRKDFQNTSALKALAESINYEINYIQDLYSVCLSNTAYIFNTGDDACQDIMSVIMYDKNLFYMWLKLFKCIDDPRILTRIPWTYFE